MEIIENTENKIDEHQKTLNNKMKIIFLNSFKTINLENTENKNKEISNILSINDYIEEDSKEIEPQKNQTKEEKSDIFSINIIKEEDSKELEFQKKQKYAEILNYKDNFNLKKITKPFHLFYYKCRNPIEDKIAYKIGKMLLFTYRKNFPKITNYKNKKTYTSDTNWGCMLRCGQMILSHGIYRTLKAKKIDTKNALYYSFSLFNNFPIKESNLHKYFNGMLNKYNLINKENGENNNKKIVEFFPPFSIKTICQFGELSDRCAGEWFSDVIMTYIFKKISDYYELFNNPNFNLKIMNFHSCIEI